MSQITITNPVVDDYCRVKSSRPSKDCAAIYNYTKKNVPMSQMLIGELEASFLRSLLRANKAKRVLEIGCYTGYSALAMAEVLPANGKVITLDIDPNNTAIAKKFWAKSKHGKKIELILGPAIISIKKLTGKFDFVFIDADKPNYLNYLKLMLPKLSSNGVIAADNCLWGGEVVRKTQDANTKALQAFNDYVSKNSRLVATLVPIRDGIFLIQKS